MIILYGGTGSGKTCVAKSIEGRGYRRIVTYTTRPPREGEINGVDYHFIDNEEFLKKKENGFFGETNTYSTVCGKWYYGSAWEDYSRDSIIILTPSGITKLLSQENKTQHYDIFPVFIKASKTVIMKRLCGESGRGDNNEEVERRLKADDIDFIGAEELSRMIIINEGSRSPYQIANEVISKYEEFLSTPKQKKLIYISHKYQNNPENKYRVRDIIKYLVKKYPDYIFLSPIHAFGFLYADVSYKEGLDMCLALLRLSDEMWVFDDYDDSTGVLAEIAFCKNNNITYRICEDIIIEKEEVCL